MIISLRCKTETKHFQLRRLFAVEGEVQRHNFRLSAIVQGFGLDVHFEMSFSKGFSLRIVIHLKVLDGIMALRRREKFLMRLREDFWSSMRRKINFQETVLLGPSASFLIKHFHLIVVIITAFSGHSIFKLPNFSIAVLCDG